MVSTPGKDFTLKGLMSFSSIKQDFSNNAHTIYTIQEV